MGQVLSLLLASAGAAQATLHLNCGLSAPTFTMALVYLGLLLAYFPILLFSRKRRCYFQQRERGEQLATHDRDNEDCTISDLENDEEKEDIMYVDSNTNVHHNITNNENHSQYPLLLNRSLLWYLLMSFVDVEANAVTMLAFRYTTLTSVTLFDSLAKIGRAHV